MGKNKFKIALVLVWGLLSLNQGFGQAAKTQWTDAKEFCRSDKDDLVNIWGSGISIPGIYFKEHLPALFKRKLTFSKSDLKTTKLRWLFTGNVRGDHHHILGLHLLGTTLLQLLRIQFR